MRAAGGFLEANEVHGNWYGTPRGQVREALAAGRDVILKIDVQGAQVVKEQVPEALLDLPRPAVARGPVPAAAQPGDRDRRRARGPPAQRRDRAGAPGRLRLRRDQRDRPGRADRRADRRDHRRGARPPPRPAGRGLLRGRRDRRRRCAAPRDAPAWTVPRAAGSAPSRSRSTRPGGAGTGPTPTSCPRRSPTSSRARRSSSSSGGGRRSGSSSPRRPCHGDVAAKPIVDRVRADGPLLPPLTPRAGAAGSPRTTSRRRRWSSGRCCRRGCSSGSSSSPSVTPGDAAAAADARRRPDALGPDRRRPARRSSSAGRDRSATSPGPRGAPGCCAACGRSRRDGADQPRMDARSAPGPGRATSAGSGSPTAGDAAAATLAAGGRPTGRPLGPRQVDGPRGARRSPDAASCPAADLAGRHGQRRRRRPRPARARRGRGPGATAPTARRAARRPARRPAARRATCSPAQAEAVERGPRRDRRAATRARSCSTA